MNIRRDEFGHEYEHYRFGYCEYAELEPGDSIATIYANGFLPLSADPSTQGTFYMARSARITPAKWQATSENRRIFKRFDGLFTHKTFDQNALLADEHIRDLFVSYFKERHGTSVMPVQRFRGICTWPVPLTCRAYYQDNRLCAAVLEVNAQTVGHFWFSAYDLTYAHHSLGMWLMQDGVRIAQEHGQDFYYLGTVYGAKALYKANLMPLEFWTGSTWSTDVQALKRLARSES